MTWEDAPLILIREKIVFSNFPIHETKFQEIIFLESEQITRFKVFITLSKYLLLTSVGRVVQSWVKITQV